MFQESAYLLPIITRKSVHFNYFQIYVPCYSADKISAKIWPLWIYLHIKSKEMGSSKVKKFKFMSDMLNLTFLHNCFKCTIFPKNWCVMFHKKRRSKLRRDWRINVLRILWWRKQFYRIQPDDLIMFFYSQIVVSTLAWLRSFPRLSLFENVTFTDAL